MKHKCPVDGCEAKVPHEILMCYPHWKQVPKDLQYHVNKTWRSGDAAKYLEARAASVAAVNQKLKGGI